MNTNYPPIRPGTAVSTTEPDMALRKDWSDDNLGAQKWGVQGKVFAHGDSHSLCYCVRHEDGTEAWYDPSELEIIVPAPNYLLIAEAEWVSSCEHPMGKRDIHSLESRTLEVRFEACDDTAARTEAKRCLEGFESDLPKKREGGLSWQGEDAKIVSTTFARILDL